VGKGEGGKQPTFGKKKKGKREPNPDVRLIYFGQKKKKGKRKGKRRVVMESGEKRKRKGADPAVPSHFLLLCRSRG